MRRFPVGAHLPAKEIEDVNMMTKTVFLLRDLLLMHRAETIVFIAPACAWGSMVALSAGGGPLFLVVLGTLLNIGAAYNGFLGNTYADYELDLGSPSKKAITNAVASIGKGRVLALFIVEIAVLAFFFYRYHHLYAGAYATDLWFWLGIGGRYAYNFRPLRLKERGVLNMVFYALNFGVAPVLLGWSIVFDSYPTGVIFITGGTALVTASQALWGASVDYRSDREAGARTVAVVLGQRTSLIASQLFMACSIPFLVYGIYSVSAPQGHGQLSRAAVAGLLIVAAGLLYSMADRIRYVLFADERSLVGRLDNKYRQLTWLLSQCTSVVIGCFIIWYWG